MDITRVECSAMRLKLPMAHELKQGDGACKATALFAFFRGDFVPVFESYPSIYSVFCPCHLEILHVEAPKVL